jgi:hypothetical protein
MFVQADYCELCETARPCACDVEIDAQDKTPYERELEDFDEAER